MEGIKFMKKMSVVRSSSKDHDVRGIILSAFLILITVFASSAVFVRSAEATAFYTRSTNTWSNRNTWSTGSCGGGRVANGVYPGSGGNTDTVQICAGHAVTVNLAAVTVASITFNAPTTMSNGILISSPNVLTVTGAITMNAPTNSSNSTLSVGTGTLSAGSISITGSATTARNTTVSVSTGTINCNGNLSFFGTAAQAQLTFSDAGQLNITGNMGAGGTFTASTGTVNFNGTGAQNVNGGYTYNVLKANNAVGVTLGSATTIKTLTIGDVTAGSIFSDGGYTITPGASSILNLTSGTYKLGSSGTATSWPVWGTGNIASGTTVEYAAGVAQTVSTTPSYQNLTFSGAGTKTTGSGTLSIAGDWAVGSATALDTNNTAVSLSGNLSGSGNISLGSGSHSIGGNCTNNGTSTAGTGTVTYGGSAQTVCAWNYNNLTFSGSGAKSMDTGTLVSGNLSIAGTATASVTAGQNLSVGTLTLGGLGRINGTWGSTSSAATSKNDTYFAATTGILTVATDTRATSSITGSPTGSSSITYGAALSTITPNGGSGSPAGGTFTWTSPTTVPAAGTTTAGVTYTPSDLTSYTTSSGIGNITVNQRSVTLSGSRAYDTTTVAAAGILSITNKVGADDVTVASGSATLASANVGTPSISSMGTLVLGGAAAPNYTLSGASGSVTINPGTPTASITNTPVTYNGSAQTATPACLGGGTATLASGGTGTNAGSYPATVNCAASTNYAAALGLSAGDFVINPGTPTASITQHPSNI